MEVFYYPYELKSKYSGKIRKGALLRIDKNNEFYYSDLFPWPEFGDQSLQEQILNLKNKPSALAKRSLEISQNKFSKLNSSFKNHFLVTDIEQINQEIIELASRNGFSVFKIKAMPDPNAFAKRLNQLFVKSNFKLRIDFNAKYSFNDIEKFVKHLETSLVKKIEFLEDPIAWDLKSWNRIKSDLEIPLAIDFEISKVKEFDSNDKMPFDYLVLKPNRQNFNEYKDIVNKYNLKIICTSSLEHPVGIYIGVKLAEELQLPKSDFDFGFSSFSQYEETQFHKYFEINNAKITIQEGFLENLKGLSWIHLK